MIKEQLLLYDRKEILNQKCFACNKIEHTEENCPYIHFVPNREKILKEYFFPHKQIKRKKFQRTTNRKKSLCIRDFMISSEYLDKVENQSSRNLGVKLGTINSGFSEESNFESENNFNFDKKKKRVSIFFNNDLRRNSSMRNFHHQLLALHEYPNSARMSRFGNNLIPKYRQTNESVYEKKKSLKILHNLENTFFNRLNSDEKAEDLGCDFKKLLILLFFIQNKLISFLFFNYNLFFV